MIIVAVRRLAQQYVKKSFVTWTGERVFVYLDNTKYTKSFVYEWRVLETIFENTTVRLNQS